MLSRATATCWSESNSASLHQTQGASTCLQNWMRQDDVEAGVKPGVTKSEADELRELRKRNRLLEQENEVLRKAAAYLSQANLKLGGSPK